MITVRVILLLRRGLERIMEENIRWELLNIVTLPVDLGRVWESTCFWSPLKTEDGTLTADTDIFLFKEQPIM